MIFINFLSDEIFGPAGPFFGSGVVVSQNLIPIGLQGRGEYNVLFGDKGNGIVFGFSANFGNVLGGAKRRPKYFQKMIKHFRKIILQNISHKEAKHFQK